jgi:hypothetical protein
MERPFTRRVNENTLHKNQRAQREEKRKKTDEERKRGKRDSWEERIVILNVCASFIEKKKILITLHGKYC